MNNYPRFLRPKNPNDWSKDIRFLRIEADGSAWYVFSNGGKSRSGYVEDYWQRIMIRDREVFEITEAEAALL